MHEVLRDQDRPNRRIVIAALGVTQILAWGSTFYLLGVLANPIASDTGWRYDWIISGVSVGLLTAGVVAPHVGRAISERVAGRFWHSAPFYWRPDFYSSEFLKALRGI